jgi:hypothetical protein
MTALRSLLLQRKGAIAERWLHQALAVYPPDALQFYERERDRFANPVGQALRTGTETLLEVLLEEQDPARLRAPLEEILKIRSIQDLTPSQAVGFVFRLKDVVREEIRGEVALPTLAAELATFEARVEELTLLAFDVYVKCRELVYELRVHEVKRNVAGLLRRLNAEE